MFCWKVFVWWAPLNNQNSLHEQMHEMPQILTCTILHKWFSLHYKWRTTGPCEAYHKALATAMHLSCNLHSPKPWLLALVMVLFIVPLKADLQVLSCSSEFHDNDHSLMPAQEAMSDDYAQGTPSSEECVCSTKVGSKNRRSLNCWSWWMTMVTLL
jgi:hypothetical protein